MLQLLRYPRPYLGLRLRDARLKRIAVEGQGKEDVRAPFVQ